MSVKTVTPAPAEKVEMIPLNRIVNKFDVRVSLDEDRVIQFAGLYEAGVKLPPVRVVRLDEDHYAYIDGRHRGASRAYLNLTDIPAVVANGPLRDNPVELFAEALELNWGGAKPPSREDITHTILRMLELGASWKSITDRLTFLPTGSARAYISWAQSVLQKRRLSVALDSIAEGMSVGDAAHFYKLKPDFIKNVISGKKGKWGGNRSEQDQLSAKLKSYISTKLFAANAGISKNVQFLFQKVESGEVSPKVCSEVLKNWSEHMRKTTIRIDDWKARLEAVTREREKAVKKEE